MSSENQDKNRSLLAFEDPEPFPDQVDGSEILCELAKYVSDFSQMPEGGSEAVAVWAAATWFVEHAYIAPILALQSPTKRTGKTTVLDLLSRVVRRPLLTSGVGATPAVLFRANDKFRPTFLLDEAEKLRTKFGGGSQLISLLNSGHRRGGTVQRCAEVNGSFRVETFDAFGFRAVALIGDVWDTLADRAIILRMQRATGDADILPFLKHIEDVETRGELLARKLVRWASGVGGEFRTAWSNAEYPDWLNDRERDNWSTLLGVAQLAGGQWPSRLRDASRQLASEPAEDGDPGERLIHDIREIFETFDRPEAIKSGDLVRELGDIETSPWGEKRGGKGLSTHKLARMLKPFGVRPNQDRTSAGEKVRGYWLSDLQPVFDRYSCP